MYLEGQATIASGASQVSIVFSPAFSARPYVRHNVSNISADVGKSVIGTLLDSFTQDGEGNYTGAVIKLSAAAPSANYKLDWQAGINQATAPIPQAASGITLASMTAGLNLSALEDFRLGCQIQQGNRPREMRALDKAGLFGSVPSIESVPTGPLQALPSGKSLPFAVDRNWLYVGTNGRWARVPLEYGTNWQQQPWLVPFREGEVTITPVVDQQEYEVTFATPFTGTITPRILLDVTNTNTPVQLLSYNITARSTTGFTVTFSDVPQGPVQLYYLARQTLLTQGGGGPGYEIVWPIVASDETTLLTVGTNKVRTPAPFALTINEIVAVVTGGTPSGASIQLDVKRNGTSIFSTVLSIDAGESSSATAAVPAVISDGAFDQFDILSVDITQVGVGSNAGAGLKLLVYATLTEP